MEDDKIKDEKEISGNNSSKNGQSNSSEKDYSNKDYNYRSHKASYNEESYEDKRGRRAFNYVWNIVWSIIAIIFFNFYSDYIAYFQYEQSNGTLIWHRFSLITSDFSKLVPLISATLIVIIAGNIILLIFDRYILARIVDLISSIFVIVVLGNFLIIFPIDFNIIPYEKVTQWMPLGLKISLGIIILVLAAQVIANFVKIIANIAKK